jgi:hypothetical protein
MLCFYTARDRGSNYSGPLGSSLARVAVAAEWTRPLEKSQKEVIGSVPSLTEAHF